MATLLAVLVESKFVAATLTTQFTAVAPQTIIGACTISNGTAGAVTITAHIVPSGDTAVAANTLISARSISPGATDPCPELTGQVLLPGDFISTQAGAASSLTLRISGRTT